MNHIKKINTQEKCNKATDIHWQILPKGGGKARETYKENTWNWLEGNQEGLWRERNWKLFTSDAKGNCLMDSNVAPRDFQWLQKVIAVCLCACFISFSSCCKNDSVLLGEGKCLLWLSEWCPGENSHVYWGGWRRLENWLSDEEHVAGKWLSFQRPPSSSSDCNYEHDPPGTPCHLYLHVLPGFICDLSPALLV